MLIKWDIKLFHSLNGLAGRFRLLDYFGIFCAVYLIWLMSLFALGLFWQISPAINRLKYLFTLLAASVGAYLVNMTVGLALVRTRPFGAIDGVHQLITTSFLHKSFPSSHATIAFALAFTVFFFNRTWGIPMLIAAVLVALGRVYVGVHYPADILAGAIIGGVVSYGVYRLIT